MIMESSNQDDHYPNIDGINVRALAENTLASTSEHLRQRRAQKILQNVSTNQVKPGSPAYMDLNPCLDISTAINALNCVPTKKNPSVSNLPNVNRSTDGLTWVRVQSNLRLPDDVDFDFFVPYLGESEAHLKSSNELAQDLFESNSESEENVSDVEKNSMFDVNQHWDDDPSSVDNDEPTSLRRRSVHKRHGRRRKPKVSHSVWDRIAKRVAVKKVVDQLNLPSPKVITKQVKEAFRLGSEDHVKSYFKIAKSRAEAWITVDKEKCERDAQKDEVLKLLRGETKQNASTALAGDSLAFHFCRQCYVYHCSIHAALAARPNSCPPDKTRKDHDAGSKEEKRMKSACTIPDRQHCWYFREQSGQDSQHPQWWQQISNDDQICNDLKAVIRELLKCFGHDYCRLSSSARAIFTTQSDIMRISCSRIGYMCKLLYNDTETGICPPSRSRKRSRRYVASAEDKRTGLRADYLPCMHEGPCTSKNCSCIKDGIFCEKFCSCNSCRQHDDGVNKVQKCRAAFQGCNCKTTVSCNSRVCPCYCAGRECDPDVCGPCQGCKGSGLERSCKNMGLLLGEKQRVVVGKSPIHGWGAFAVENIPKKTIIGEYVGEIIPQHQAERRGRVYDEANYSFLFNTTDELAIDSTRLGNKLRYCNHSTNPNCEPRLLRVRGDVRVGIFAKRDIVRHEELTFNYQYNGRGPAWANMGSSNQKALPVKCITESDEDYEESSEPFEVIPPSKRRNLGNMKTQYKQGPTGLGGTKARASSSNSDDDITPNILPDPEFRQDNTINDQQPSPSRTLENAFGSDLERDSQQTATASPISNDEPSGLPKQAPINVSESDDEDWEPKGRVRTEEDVSSEDSVVPNGLGGFSDDNSESPRINTESNEIEIRTNTMHDRGSPRKAEQKRNRAQLQQSQNGVTELANGEISHEGSPTNETKHDQAPNTRNAIHSLAPNRVYLAGDREHRKLPSKLNRSSKMTKEGLINGNGRRVTPDPTNTEKNFVTLSERSKMIQDSQNLFKTSIENKLNQQKVIKQHQDKGNHNDNFNSSFKDTLEKSPSNSSPVLGPGNVFPSILKASPSGASKKRNVTQPMRKKASKIIRRSYKITDENESKMVDEDIIQTGESGSQTDPNNTKPGSPANADKHVSEQLKSIERDNEYHTRSSSRQGTNNSPKNTTPNGTVKKRVASSATTHRPDQYNQNAENRERVVNRNQNGQSRAVAGSVHVNRSSRRSNQFRLSSHVPEEIDAAVELLETAVPAPIVNLVSEDEGGSTGDSYEPDFYTWMR